MFNPAITRLGTSARRLGATAALCVCLLAIGCAPQQRSAVQGVDPGSWDADRMRKMQPCLLALGPDDNGTDCLRAFLWDSTQGALLWSASRDQSAQLLDADAATGRVIVSVTPRSPRTPSDIADTLLALEPDGRVVVRDEPGRFPMVSGAVIAGDSVLLLRRRESAEAVETTLVVVSTNANAPVTVTGLPPHQDIVGIRRLQGGSVALLLKLNGSPAPRDDFAVVAARLKGRVLSTISGPVLDDSLFSVAPGPAPNTAVYVRSAEPSERAIVSLVFSDSGVGQNTLLSESDIDPGFEHSRVLGAGPDGSVLFRSLGTTEAPARLRMIASGDTVSSETSHTFPPIGDDWLWLGSPAD